MIKKLRLRSDRHTISKIICGGLVAAALVLIPLPTLADESSPAQTSPATSSATPSPASDKQTDTSLQAAPVDTAGTLDASGSKQESTPSTPQAQPSAQTKDASAPSASDDSQAPKATIDTTIKADTDSGDATVKDNRTGGNASSGNSETSATSVNVANANGVTAGNFQTFNCDIRDDIQGSIVIDPTTLMPFCSNTPATASTSQGGDGSLQTSAGLADILNNIVLSAGSGDATVNGNRTGGDATSGNATALANVVNIANSAISAKNSFVGVINIYSDVQGDILVPQSIVDGLAQQGSIPGANQGQTSVSNNLDAAATSGDATVKDNRTGGDATSGNAATSMTVMNLTGQQVVAKNSLLVFVNVLGKWMGMIVPAPGANTAMLGSGIQTSQAPQVATQNPGGNGSGSQSSITNNISVKAASGDASVTGNRTGGNATSGSAQAGINLLNITDSNFKLDDWFGALFINVLGNWLGNFDIQKLAGQPADGAPPISDIKVYQIQQEAPVQNLRPANTAVKPAGTAPQTASAEQPVSTDTDLGQVSQTTGTVLGSSSQREAVEQTGGFRVGLPMLAAIVIALTLITAALTRIVRNRLAAHGR